MSNSSIDTDDNDFVLKHRIAGAAFLLFFGALVLPWLLGPPSDAKKSESANETVAQIDEKEEFSAEDLENEVLKQLQDEIVKDQQVYVSKVTPNGFTKVSDSEDDRKAKEQKEALEQARLKKQQQEKAAALSEQTKTKEKAQQAEDQALAIVKKAQESQKASSAEKNIIKNTAKSDTSSVADNKKTDDEERAKAFAAALEAESKKNITSGWVVQVGVFTDKAGADKISKTLSTKGFETSTTTVDTNLGANTGTRVWLGPFADRAEASKEKKRLSEKTGTSGFVRAYP